MSGIGSQIGSVVGTLAGGWEAYQDMLQNIKPTPTPFPGIQVYETSLLPEDYGVTLPPAGIFVGKGSGLDTKQHEYGHYLQYKDMGAGSFYWNVGLPSIYNVAENNLETVLFGKLTYSVDHRYYSVETDANQRALNFFGSSIDKNFNNYFPTNTRTTPYNWYERMWRYFYQIFK